jgi:hypothetical protein
VKTDVLLQRKFMIQSMPVLHVSHRDVRIQLEVCRLANMSVAASLASQNALGVACKDS